MARPILTLNWLDRIRADVRFIIVDQESKSKEEKRGKSECIAKNWGPDWMCVAVKRSMAMICNNSILHPLIAIINKLYWSPPFTFLEPISPFYKFNMYLSS